jgi:hypothetical protein
MECRWNGCWRGGLDLSTDASETSDELVQEKDAADLIIAPYPERASDGEKDRERGRPRVRQRQTERERERETDRDRETERETGFDGEVGEEFNF